VQYNENNIRIDYIKYILGQSFIPNIQVWHRGKMVVEGVYYVYKNSIVRVNQYFNGIPREHDEINPETGERYPFQMTVDAFFEKIYDYVWGDNINGMTVKYESKDISWFRLDHYVLGLYLRAQRDLFDRDLMWAYNCWDGGMLNRSLERINNTTLRTAPVRLGKKTLTIPIVPNQDYTVFIDCQTEVLGGVAFVHKDRPITSNLMNSMIFGQMQIGQPMKIHIDWSESTFNAYRGIQEFMTLLLQVPESVHRIYVLEGDYTDRAIEWFGQFNPNDSIVVDFVKSPLRSVAFDDRLFEYLSEHPVTKDQFEDSIRYVQTVVSSREFFDIGKGRLETRGIDNPRYTGQYEPGIWDLDMQRWIRQVFGDETLMRTKFGISAITMQNGEVIKEIEAILKGVMANVI
jgi:hypothetical protein